MREPPGEHLHRKAVMPGRSRRSFLAILATAATTLLWIAACCRSQGASRHPRQSGAEIVLLEAFSLRDPAEPLWQATPTGAVRLDAAQPHGSGFSLTAKEDFQLSRRLDVVALRGRRIEARLSAHMLDDTRLRLRLKVQRARGEHTSGDSGDIRLLGPAHLVTVIEVPADATSMEVTIDGTGPGRISLHSLEIRSSPASRDRHAHLNPATLARLHKVALAVSAVQYFSPESWPSRAVWNSKWSEAVELALTSTNEKQFEARLEKFLQELAPGALLERAGDTAKPPAGPGQTRWIHVGLGLTEYYASFRPTVDKDELSQLDLSFRLPSPSRCTNLSVSAQPTFSETGLEADLYIIANLPGRGVKWKSVPLKGTGGAVELQYTPPTESVSIDVGVTVEGHAGELMISALEVKCDAALYSINRIGDLTVRGFTPLFELSDEMPCGSASCIRIRRHPPSILGPHGPAVVDVGDTTQLVFPLDVPPAVALRAASRFRTSGAAFPPSAIETRLAAVLETWATLRHFYPYWDLVDLRWEDALDEALVAASQTADSSGLANVLSKLLAKLGDGHGYVYHSSIDISGALPLFFRRYGERFYVAGGVAEYIAAVGGLGAEVQEIAGQPINALFRSTLAVTSSSTVSSGEYAALRRLGYGPKGALASLRVVTAAGVSRTVAIPYLDRNETYLHLHEPRPATGSVKPGIVYVDAASITRDELERLEPLLASARGVVIDARGEVAGATYDLLAHFLDAEAHSPEFAYPLVTIDGIAGWVDSRWQLRPATHRFGAQLAVLVDERTISASETFAQIVVGSGAGTLIGRSTAGTNGNVITFEVAGGYSIRFTGMRARNVDGSRLHGKGLQPAVLVDEAFNPSSPERDPALLATISILEANGRATR